MELSISYEEYLKRYKEIEDSLSVSIKIDHNQVDELVVKELIKKRNFCEERKDLENLKAFNEVLMYYLGQGDFEKYVVNGEEV